MPVFPFESESCMPYASNSNRRGSRNANRGLGNTKAQAPKRKRLVLKICAKSEIYPNRIVIDLPLQTKSEANCFEPWQVKHRRRREQQAAVSLVLRPHRDKILMPCNVMLTRFAPDKLDAFDNLPMSFKYIVDAICAIITGDYRPGRADSNEGISIRCGQEKSNAYGIRIEITW